MAFIQHFPDISIVNEDMTVDIKLSILDKRFEYAQQWLGDRVLEACKPVMPLSTGSLQQRSYVAEDGRKVVFPGPYARFLYMGKVMVDPDTGSPWAREGAKKVVTDRDLTFSNPTATSHWAEEAWARNGEAIIKGVGRILGGDNG